MAQNAYLRLKGEMQGTVEGSASEVGRVGTIPVFALDHKVQSPRQPRSPLPTGRHLHQPFTVTKAVDMSTPLLYRMLAVNETITEWELQFWGPHVRGGEQPYFTVELQEAQISSIQFEMPKSRHPGSAEHGEVEHVSFVYNKIVWTWVQGGITAQDDWEAPIV